MTSIANKLAVITGASQGIGRAIAEIFLANGYDLLLNSKDEGRLSECVRELKNNSASSRIEAMATDLSKKNNAIDFGDWCLSKGVPNILVNNAGIYSPGNIFEESDGAFEAQLETNLHSAYHLTRALVPSMIKNDSGSQRQKHIFNICSIASLDAYPNGGSYSISKFALLGFSKNLREDLKTFGVKVSHVIPGAVYTSSWNKSGVSPQRIMESEDIAKMVYAASTLSFQACVEEIIIRPQLGDL